MYAHLVNMIMTRLISFCASVSEPNCVYAQTCMSVFMCVVRPRALKVAVSLGYGCPVMARQTACSDGGSHVFVQPQDRQSEKIPAWQTQNNQAVNICTS